MSEDLATELGQNIPLSEMIQSLRQELQVALATGKDAAVRFAAERVELELEVELEDARSVGGGVKFWVLSGKGETKHAHTQHHTFKVTLVPLTKVGGKLVVGTDPSAQPPT